VALAPGAAIENIKPGGEIDNTQGAVDLFGLIGSVMRPQGGEASSSAPPAASASTPAESY
jgi:phospholipid/cholesterol/gamma-HCH transport system substrate-binding protein